MILTSHRLDCFKLAIDMLVQGGSIARFDIVAVLCSGVEGRHRRYVESLAGRYPDTRWEIINGPRGRGKPISDLQNECVRRHPHALYFKLDEDTFVSSDWDIEIVKAYEQFKSDERLSLITATVTNNQRGSYYLLNLFAELGTLFTNTFQKPIVAERMGPVWLSPQCAAFMIRRFLSLEAGNREIRARNRTAFETFSHPFSINCICYDYRHWLEIGGVPEQDENGWGEWIPKNGKIIVLARNALVHHYSFFVQQDWLDRSALLEELREANVPGRLNPVRKHLPRAIRVARQIPRVLRRRLKPNAAS